MSRRQRSSAIQGVVNAPAEDQETHATEQRERLAELIAQGEAPFPEVASPVERARLIVVVAKHRHTRLIRFIAHAIAHDIARSRPKSKKGSSC